MLKDLLKTRVTTKWWSDKIVEDDKVEYVLDCIRRAPSKQLNYNFKVIIFDESKRCKEIKNWLYWEHTYCLNKIRGGKGEGLKRFNGQVLAPIVIAWASEKNDLEVIEDIMVSSTTALLAAEEIGLDTGFNGCLEAKELGQKIGEPYVHMLLGMGYSDNKSGDNIRKVYKDGVEVGWDLDNGAQGECINNNIGEYYGR
tara:strand:- start:11 stop:604 length:594 start_codon:yes stop_codon:yes gene_type:complete